MTIQLHKHLFHSRLIGIALKMLFQQIKVRADMASANGDQANNEGRLVYPLLAKQLQDKKEEGGAANQSRRETLSGYFDSESFRASQRRAAM